MTIPPHHHILIVTGPAGCGKSTIAKYLSDRYGFDYIEGDDTVWEQAPMERLAHGGQLAAYRHRGFWQPMDTLRDKTVLNELWESGRAPWKVWADRPAVEIQDEHAPELRFDVVGVLVQPDRPALVTHLRAAFS